MVSEHARVTQLLGAWALDACEPEEAGAVDAHLAACATCAAEADRLREVTGRLATDREVPPPVPLRGRVLAAATAARRAAPPLATVVPDYRAEVEALDRLLGGLSARQWRAVAVRDRPAQDLLAHLAASDGLLAAQLGLPEAVAPEPGATPPDRDRPAPPARGAVPPERTRAVWRAQADALLRATPAPDVLVHLADRRLPRRTYADALVQRAFETWVHDGDLRLATGRPPRPPAGGLAGHVAALGVDLLPYALRRAGAAHPGRTARLRLAGAGGGEWVVALSPDTPAGRPDVEVALDVLEFCVLMGDRRTPRTLRHTVAGDRTLAADLLRAVATLGCEEREIRSARA